jgi:DNA helicase-2/ATP-dependent DNA helicase PcrA
LHSLYNQSFLIADEEDTNSVYKDIFKTMTKGASKDFTQAITGKISDLKTEGYFLQDVRENMVPTDSVYTFKDLVYVYGKYEAYMLRSNLLDFDDLLMLTQRILASNPVIREEWQKKYQCILVDEFQDTNGIQYDLIKNLMGPNTKLTVVGDPDQTIYTWRGAKNEIIKDSLKKDFPSLDTVILDDNYRSTQAILDVSNSLIKNNKDRMDKSLVAASHVKGDPVEYFKAADNDNEAYHIATIIHKLVDQKTIKYSDFAIIYRSNYLSNSIEKQLTNFRIPYCIYGGLKFFERAEIKDALSYLRLAVNPDDISFLRILKAPQKGIGEVTLQAANSLRDLTNTDLTLFTIFKDYRTKLRITNNSALALDRFYKAYQVFEDVYLHHENNDELISAIRQYFNDTGFNDYVIKEDKKNEEKLSYTASSSSSKMDNVQEFIRSLTQFLGTEAVDDDGSTRPSTLEDYLMDVALQSDQDSMSDTDQVSLMTGHVSKGLEFPYVFVTGLNQMIFPTTHALMNTGRAAIEEERRLLYVCMTRAKKRLYLSSFSGINFRNGCPYTPSMFLKELNLLSLNPQPVNDYSANVGTHRASNSLFGDNRRIDALMAASSPSSPKSAEVYHVGDKVIHTSFGVGNVKEVTGDGHYIVVVFPDPFGQKKLMVGFKAFRKMREDEK